MEVTSPPRRASFESAGPPAGWPNNFTFNGYAAGWNIRGAVLTWTDAIETVANDFGVINGPGYVCNLPIIDAGVDDEPTMIAVERDGKLIIMLRDNSDSELDYFAAFEFVGGSWTNRTNNGPSIGFGLPDWVGNANNIAAIAPQPVTFINHVTLNDLHTLDWVFSSNITVNNLVPTDTKFQVIRNGVHLTPTGIAQLSANTIRATYGGGSFITLAPTLPDNFPFVTPDFSTNDGSPIFPTSGPLF